MQTIPTLSDPYYTIRVRLEERNFLLKFLYSPRQERYYLSLYNGDDGTPLVCGLKLVTNLPLLRFYKHRDGMPAGDLLVTCAFADRSPPKIGELGSGLRCELTYYTQAELAEATAQIDAAGA